VKLFLTLFFPFFYLIGLEIVVDTNNNYSVLTMQNDKNFICKKKDNYTIVCKFPMLPDTPVFSTNTLFFKISPFFDKQQFYMKISSKNRIFIKSFKKNLYNSYEKHLKNPLFAKKWVFIAYKKRVPFLSNKQIKGLKFPLKIETDFYLKAVDINGNPIDYDTQTADVIEYFTILKLAKKENLTLNRVDDFLETYPNSIFLPDVLFLKLKLLDENGGNDEIIKIANDWIQKYSFNEHLPEIILLLAKAYANNGMIEDATYMYERLFTEYENSKYAYKGMIYLADELYSAGDNKRAFELYKEAFTKTKDIEVASLGASRIAQRYLEEGNLEESKKYYQKLLKANRNYLLKDKEKAYKLAVQLADNNLFDIAIIIGEEIFKKLNKDDDLYETLIYKIAIWSFEDKNYIKSQKYIDIYLDKFPFGDYHSELNSLKDKIIFQIPDKNESLMLQRFDEIIKKYPNTKLAEKATIKKGEFLFKTKRYEQFLNLKLKEFNKTAVKIASKNVVIKFLENNCFKAIQFYKDYNVSLPKQYDEQLFKCAFKSRAFNIASRVCNKYLLSDKVTTLKWLKNKLKVFEATNNYEKIVLIVEDICRLENSCYPFKYKQFFAYYKLNNSIKFLEIASKIDKNRIKSIDIFKKVVLYGIKENNDLLIYTYSKKIIELQNRKKVYTESPFIEFLFVKEAKKLNKKGEAIAVLKTLLKRKFLKDNDKARGYYLLASLTGDKNYLKKCVKLQKSVWQGLCKDSLDILEN